ncbi:major facilitator superfamily transporter [Truncatella angustata]|uniref:Major facilitator superfamily transporter n=1 Tax=Truncatella angustata TaxID=152316 RepID=A0A9P8ZUR6_9PEZI|nr:major facilitator superfamily transporter [Truncatella angustata]KAH6651944.1 major facilitator superfamily transporter [Truncatella angustata]
MSNEKVVDVEAGWTVRPHDGRHHSHISQVVQRLDTEDADEAYGGAATHHATNINDNPAQIIISWAADDKDNPYNWPKSKKLPFVLSTMILVVNSTMGSSLPSMAIPYMMAEWGIADQEQKVLPISTYLIGYVCGPIIWGPLSEQYGRKNLTLVTFTLFSGFTLGCALAPSWSAFLVFRFFTGAVASSPIAIVAGQLADTFDDPVTRGRAFAWFMAMTVFGPLLAPIISGFCSTTIGWRWSFWIGLIYAGFSLLVVLIIVPETYGPKLLAIRARKMRKETGNPNIFAASELESRDLSTVVSRVLTRPLRMLYSELIVTSTCMYLALCYAIFYMSFQAFPIIFQQLYGLAPGVTGLCFLSIGIGALLALPVFYAYDGYLRRAQNQKKAWSRQEEYRRVPLACIGGPLFVISLLWLGWSARTNTTFVVPMLAGIPFGLGFQLIFMALLNYLTDAYEIYAASANAAASATRSLVAVVLPFATTPMFQRLGIGGACSVLAGLSLFMCFIPFIFLWKGEQIRERSKFCIMLKQEKEAHAREADGGQRSSQLGHVPEHT